MERISKFLLIAQLGLSSIAFAQDGCFYKHENRYLNVGAMRFDETGDRLCSKLPDGEYVWVNASEFDKSGGCWYVDKYPVGAIIEMVGMLKQCTLAADGLTEWVLYKK